MKAFAQGEIYARQITDLPQNLEAFSEKDTAGRWIIAHSESGHHHLLGSDGVAVMERTSDAPEGLRILYAIVKEPTKLFQDATVPHDPVSLDPGIYEFRIAREFDPFSEQARRVAD